MPILEDFLKPEEANQLAKLTSPVEIQIFLDSTPYAAENRNRSPLNVLRDRFAHCLDGGLFGAMALRRLGFPALIVDLLPEPGMDDDHVLAIYKSHSCYGAIAKSNFSGLRLREPIFRNLRELTMSYFEDFFNLRGQKTLRAYSRPVNLGAYDRYNWEWDDRGADRIEQRLLQSKPISLLSPTAVNRLNPVDQLSYQAGMLGTNPAGLYQPGKGH
jgi:hypothetical protein